MSHPEVYFKKRRVARPLRHMALFHVRYRNIAHQFTDGLIACRVHMFSQKPSAVILEFSLDYLFANIIKLSDSQACNRKRTEACYIHVRFLKADSYTHMVPAPPLGGRSLYFEPESAGKAYGIILRDKPDASCNLATWSETVKVLQELLILAISLSSAPGIAFT